MKLFSNMWKASKKPRKQRKYRAKAPLHIKQSFLSSNLSKELREKHSTRNIPVVKGDEVKILRGQFKKLIGKVETVDHKKQKVFVKGAEVAKKDGSKSFYPLNASNIQIVKLITSDKKRIKNGKKSS